MMKYLMILIMLFSFNLFAVTKEYVPENSVVVLSAKIDNISLKAGKSTKDLLNNLVFDKLAENFSEYRRDNRVSYTFQNDVVSLLDFQKDSKILMLDTMKTVVMADVLDLEKLDLLMIRIALEEGVDIISGDGITFRYLKLDETFSFAWNKEVFALIVSVSQSLMPNSDESKSEVTDFDTAKLVFSKKDYKNTKTLIDSYSKKSDVTAWLDTYYWYRYALGMSYMYGSAVSDSPEFDKMYKDSSIVMSLDFLEGKLSAVMNAYSPNMPLDYTKLKKNLDSKVLKYANNENMIGFLSLAFNSEELGKMIDLMVKYLGDSSIVNQLESIISTLNELGIKNYADLMKLFGGDIFAYATGTDDGNMSYLVSLSVNAKEKQRFLDIVSTILETDPEEKNGGHYWSINSLLSSLSIYLKDDILYLGDETAITNVVENKPITAIATTKTNLIGNKAIAFYLDLKYALNTPYFSSMSETLEDLYFTAEYVSKSESKATIDINFIDKNTNALKSIFNLIDGQIE